jgi:integrase
MPGGRQRKEALTSYRDLDPYSIEDAKALEAKRKVQKRENRAFEMVPEAKMTFAELAVWYLALKSVKRLASYDRVRLALANFNRVFGQRVVGTIKAAELEDYQAEREEQGLAPATIDMEISIAKTMINKAFDNDMVGGQTVKAFKAVKRKLKKAANARKRILTIEEYLKLTSGKYKDKRGKTRDISPQHLRAFIIAGYNTGMRLGELRQLRWSHIDRDKKFIRLPADMTKERKPKTIPINHHVRKVLTNLPRALHHDFVFTYNGNPIKDRGGLKRSFRTACKNAEIPCGRSTPNGITFHDIRRTVKTNMLNAGVDKVHRDVILGHSLEGMDVHYMAPTEEDLEVAMNQYTGWLDEQLAGSKAQEKVG